jgi:hypothetical protein
MIAKTGLLATVAVAMGVLSYTGTAEAAGVKAGMLTCDVASGWGFIFGSSKDLHCSFSPQSSRFGEHYVGTIRKFGVDIGYTSGGVIAWAVFAPSSDLKHGALSGNYAGATASATAIVGAGANVLVGGSNRSIALQPVSIEGNTGLNVAAGIGAIELKYVP